MARFSDTQAGELIEALLLEDGAGLSGNGHDRWRQRARGGARLVAQALTRIIRGE